MDSEFCHKLSEEKATNTAFQGPFALSDHGSVTFFRWLKPPSLARSVPRSGTAAFSEENPAPHASAAQGAGSRQFCATLPAHGALSKSAATAEWEAGRSLGLEQTIELALSTS
jgi:hypothetical protein